MTKQTIEVEGLPEGWKAVGMLVDPDQYNKYVGDDGFLYWEAKIKLEKIQPRRIVLEETGEERSLSYGDWYEDDQGDVHKYLNKSFGSRRTYKVWREVNETDIPAEPELSLSVEGRKIIQFSDVPDTSTNQGHLTALCDDGSLWFFSSGSWSMFPVIPKPIKAK